ncbi:glycosyl transferase family protein [Pseudoruegeria sp. SHC-113]|uniref:glycosyl transferase family protein n=1 Tax=Pseudoruegeria sp. SHC-113 TaxID=2855439 RepID=UPI0021BB2F7F|nr:glycosyl transferase family protein [Pseudoruegeria sp. SHC-113]MCT8161077.1 glycosyl transferase family protein [Pseudoruegeria sp. SHC-113]
MSLGPYVRILGRGPGRSRSLTREEARAAFALILSGEAAPEATGALLMLMRFKGEVAEEIAGFVDALRATLPGWQGLPVQLDWPTYAAGRSRGLPWFLAAAKLVAQAGVPVLMHGWNSHQNPIASVRNALPGLGIPSVDTPKAAAQALETTGIAYVPLESLSADALRILQLRDVLNLRSAVNTTLRVMNPALAPASVQGVFHPPYRELQQDAGQLLGQHALSVIKGGGGEFERHPAKACALYGLRNGQPWEGTAAALTETPTRLADGPDASNPEDLPALWRGEIEDPFAEAVITGTAALALHSAGKAPTLTEADALAASLWAARPLTALT